jgi:hypothetical protein
MTYEEFLNFVRAKCVYETIYDDSDYKTILVIRLLDAYGMVNKAQRTWVGLTDEEIKTICLENGWDSSWQSLRFAQAIETALRSKNNG